jgi:hypothetical protein
MTYEKFKKFIKEMVKPAGAKKIRAIVKKRGKTVKGDDFLLDEIHKNFPDVSGCFSASTCLRNLVEEFVTTIPRATRILPSVRLVLEIYHVQNGGKLNTFSQELTNINNLFEDGELKDTVKNIMKLDKTQKITRETESEQAVVNKNRNPIELFYSDIVNQVEKRRSSSNWIDRFVVNQICSGTREVEQLSEKVSTFEYILDEDDERRQDKVKQIGVAKTAKESNRTIEKPLLIIQADEFMANLKIIRDEVGDDIERFTEAELSSKYNARLSAVVKQMFPAAAKMRGRLGTHFPREIYANASYQVLNHDPMSQNGWIAKVLGHKEGSLNTVVSYTGVLIRTSVGLTEKKPLTLYQELQAQIDHLKTQLPAPVLDSQVQFEAKDEEVRLKKFKRKTGMTAEQKEERLQSAVRQLEENGIKITNKSLRSMGIGSQDVNPFLKKRRLEAKN